MNEIHCLIHFVPYLLNISVNTLRVFRASNVIGSTLPVALHNRLFSRVAPNTVPETGGISDRRHFSRQVQHPQGEMRFLFFLYDQQMRLIQRWLTLQQIQVSIATEYGSKNSNGSCVIGFLSNHAHFLVYTVFKLI